MLISSEYVRGSHLIFDCEGQFFACVDSAGWAQCQVERGRGEQHFLFTCAPLKIFALERDCFRAQLKLIHRGMEKSFCFNAKFLEGGVNLPF